MKYVRVEDSGYVWHFPAAIIASNRANYYALREGGESTTKEYQKVYLAEYEFTMSDSAELIDWFSNNMDWEDISLVAELVTIPPPLKQPDLNSDTFEIKVCKTKEKVYA